MVGDAVRPALGLCRAAADPGAILRPLAQAHGVVARRSARGAGTADRRLHGMEPARAISRRISGAAVDEGDGFGIELCRNAGTGARGPSRAEPARGVRAALRAQAAEDG